MKASRMTPAPTHRSGFWSRLIALTRKEVRQLLRDRANLALGIALPALLILLFGYGISMDLANARVAVVLIDASPLAHDVTAGLRLSPYLTPVDVRTQREAEQLLADHAVQAIVTVPGDFSRALAAGQAQVQLILHGTDAATARILQGYVGGALAQWAAHRADRGHAPGGADAGGRTVGRIAVMPRLWFNAANTSTWYLVPGLIVLIMTLVGAFLTSMVMAREWERGTLEALFVTPVKPLEILLAKLIPYFVVGMLGFTMCLAAARWLFAVPMMGSLALVVLSSVLYMLVALGVGLLISAITKNQFVGSQVALVTSFLPALMLSGFLFDLNNVPLMVRVVGHLLPATHFLELIKTLMLAGNVWPIVLKNTALLAGYAVVLLGAARLATRKRLD